MAKEDNDIYEELLKLNKNFSNYFSNNKTSLQLIINFFTNLSEEYNSFGNNNKVINNHINLNTSSDALNNIFNYFYQSHISLLQKFSLFSNSIKNQIILPLLSFQKSYNKNYDYIQFEMKEIIDKISEQRNKLDIVQKQYSENYKNLLNEEDKSSLENNFYTVYLNESDILNKIYKICEDKYRELCLFVNKTEDDKNKKILNIIQIYLKLEKENLNFSINNDNNILNNINIENLKINNDINKIFSNNKTLDKEWKFIPDLESIKYNQVFERKNDNNNFEEFEIINKDETILKKFFISLQNTNNIDKKDLKKINELLQNNKFNFKFYKLFIKTFNDSLSNNLQEDQITTSSIFITKSFSNLIYLTNIINTILENIKEHLLIKENRLSFLIFEEFIKLGERTAFNNTFMCSLLSKNILFKNIIIWKNSIFNVIIAILNKEIKNYKEEKFNYQLHDDTLSNLEINGMYKYITNYQNFSENKKRYLNDKLYIDVLYRIVKIYLNHFGNYNFVLDNPTDIIEIILSDLNINDKFMINYFINYYSICLYLRRNDNYNRKKQKLQKKISIIKDNKIDIINNKYNLNITSNESKFIILKNISKFLNEKENLNLMHLNKNFNSINKIFYKQILKEKNISLKKRLHIWKSCLKCKAYSSVFNYKELMLEINKKERIQSNQKITELIIKDLKRTKCKDKESIAPIFNILRCLAYSNDDVQYYQGLNFIVLYLYELTKNEEETFILINNLISFTAFGDILENNFKKFNLYCEIIEKLIILFLPRIHAAFKDNQIKVIFFINPYLITLFTNVYVNIPENNFKFIFYVWDNFILNGWKSIFEIILAMFKCLEKQILAINRYELLSFLGNNLWKNEIFLDKNYDEFLSNIKKFKLDEQLIDLIINQINMEKNIVK